MATRGVNIENSILATSEVANLEENLETKLLHRVASSTAHFKHQQRGEPELTLEEKLDIVKDILKKSPATFLSRFGKFLIEDELVYFSQFKSDYVIHYHVNDIRKHFDNKRNETEKRNRRHEAMKNLVRKGSYFSEEEMKARDPLLYEQMIGQYLTEEEIEEQAARNIDRTDLRFSSVLTGFISHRYETELYKFQKMKEDGQEEEEESEDDDAEECDDKKWTPSDVEKTQLREEYLHIMQERFLIGEDRDFDYSEIDGNENYDPLTIRQQDEEEKYFDDYDPEDTTAMETESYDTGQLDY